MKAVLVSYILLQISWQVESVSLTQCSNPPSSPVSLEINRQIKNFKCSDISRKINMCNAVDVVSGQLVSTICSTQCLEACRSASVSSSPTPSPVSQDDLFKDSTASRFIKLPVPPVPTAPQSRSNCPHDATGLLNWSDAATWGTAGVPTFGSNVVLPKNKRIVITETVFESLGIITIPSTSQLIIGENDDGISIDAQGFIVQGKLIAGSSTCPLEKPVVITLHGARPDDVVTQPQNPEVKGIYVQGGMLSIYGKRYFQTWSRLAKKAGKGDTSLTLQQKVNWEPGQEIVVVTSSVVDVRTYHQNEVMTVASVSDGPSSGTSIVDLTEPLNYEHIANKYYQVEVGLLSRSITIQGAADDSEPTDPDTTGCPDLYPQWHLYYNATLPCFDKELTGYGGHILIEEDGVAQVQGVQLLRMGQTNVPDRFPINFKSLGECPTCLFSASSVHQSYYRCVGIQDTNSMTVTENVAYDVTGNCYFLANGLEQNNIVSYNLGALVHILGPEKPERGPRNETLYFASDNLTFPGDATASPFFIPNVQNQFVGNAASGGWAGFLFPSYPQPLQGDETAMQFRPANAIGLKFDGNTAHSTGFWYGRSAGFYFGGSVIVSDNTNSRKLKKNKPRSGTSTSGLVYYVGQTRNELRDNRRPCTVNCCVAPYNDCAYGCPFLMQKQFQMTNTKTFLSGAAGVLSWSGRLNLQGFETYDTRQALKAISDSITFKRMNVACRTGENLGAPPPGLSTKGTDSRSFAWYDEGREHLFSLGLVNITKNVKITATCETLELLVLDTVNDVQKQMRIMNKRQHLRVGDTNDHPSQLVGGGYSGNVQALDPLQSQPDDNSSSLDPLQPASGNQPEQQQNAAPASANADFSAVNNETTPDSTPVQAEQSAPGLRGSQHPTGRENKSITPDAEQSNSQSSLMVLYLTASFMLMFLPALGA